MAEEGHEVEVAPGPAAAAAAAAPAAARQGASTASPPSLLTGKKQIHELDVTDRLFNDILFLGVAHW